MVQSSPPCHQHASSFFAHPSSSSSPTLLDAAFYQLQQQESGVQQEQPQFIASLSARTTSASTPSTLKRILQEALELIEEDLDDFDRFDAESLRGRPQ